MLITIRILSEHSYPIVKIKKIRYSMGSYLRELKTHQCTGSYALNKYYLGAYICR